MALEVLRVSQLNRYVKSLLDSNEMLTELYIKGEISNLSPSAAGHIYMTLKEKTASVRGVMFARQAEHLRFMPQNAMSVIARASASIYERDGSFTLYIYELIPDGAGALEAAYEKLREKLESEGLFATEYKKALPYFPQTIGIVTSQTGAAVNDIITTITRRCPAVNIIVAPAIVQGDKAALSVATAIRRLNADGRSDVIIVGRGGGSREDLWAFNEEITVRAVANSIIPIISAVGHEDDNSLCDMAADIRAATPTAAAELAVPVLSQLQENLSDLREELFMSAKYCISEKKSYLKLIKTNSALSDKSYYIDKNKTRLNHLTQLLQNKSHVLLREKKREIKEYAKLLDALSPMKVLAKGYSVTYKEDKSVKSALELKKGDEIKTQFSDGIVLSRVIK